VKNKRPGERNIHGFVAKLSKKIDGRLNLMSWECAITGKKAFTTSKCILKMTTLFLSVQGRLNLYVSGRALAAVQSIARHALVCLAIQRTAKGQLAESTKDT